ncbi:hypothetical protein FOA52_002900 [Chlamydomonas sp. UWO 241]|nr:hypothetical protein FOA52_002900 [Chlamydomonas sp. UWO 241]
MATPVAPPPPKDQGSLKHLGFVQAGTCMAYQRAGALGGAALNTLHAYTPKFVAPRVAEVEKLFSSNATPVIHKVQDRGASLLVYADSTVDNVLTRGYGALASVRAYHDSNMESFRAASSSYYKMMSDTADRLVSALHLKGLQESTMTTVTKARETLGSALDKAREAAHPDQAVAMAWSAWTSFASLPVVAKALETAEPATKASVAVFERMHDSLVGAPLYRTLVDRTSASISYATTTTPYKLGAHYLYPLVRPVADPAISTLTTSKVYGNVTTYWRPAAIA